LRAVSYGGKKERNEMRWLTRWLNNGSSRHSREPEEPSPFRYSRLYGDEKYTLQNMLLKQVNYDSSAPLLKSVCSDHIPHIWYESHEDIGSMASGDAFWSGVMDADLMRFARCVLERLNPEFELFELTGARMVRFTHWGNGYPVLRLDVIGKRISSLSKLHLASSPIRPVPKQGKNRLRS
jgi:hypothetical protein